MSGKHLKRLKLDALSSLRLVWSMPRTQTTLDWTLSIARQMVASFE